MNFPDFLKFKPFNQLRAAMGASQLGEFEFFDPKRHLSAEEKQQLQNGLLLAKSQLSILLDTTLAYKNSRVLVSVVEPAGVDDWVYHPAACETFTKLPGPLRATTVQPNHPTGQFHVCTDCLQLLHYKGFDAVRNRHRYYSQRLHEEFDLEEFFQQYPPYPLTDHHHKHDVVI